MSRNMQTIFFSFITLFSFKVFSSEKYFVSVPSQNISCDKSADNLRLNFLNITKDMKISEVSARCLGESTIIENNQSFLNYNLLLEYKNNGPFELQFYKANYSLNSLLGQLPENGKGIYKTYEQCLNDIPSRSEEFIKNTGLKIWAQTCEQDSIEDVEGHFAYTLSIESIGIPKANLHLTQFNLLQEATNFNIQKIQEILINTNAKIVYSDSFNILFYSTINIPIVMINLGYMYENECLDQKIRLKKFLDTKSKFGNFVDCLSYPYIKNKVQLVGFLPSYRTLIADEEYKFPKFNSYNECMQLKKEIDHDLKNQNSSFCTLDLINETKYIIKLINEY